LARKHHRRLQFVLFTSELLELLACYLTAWRAGDAAGTEAADEVTKLADLISGAVKINPLNTVERLPETVYSKKAKLTIL
jgi:hypothetical protein